MSKKHFSWLLVLSIVVAAVALLLPGRTAKEVSVAQSELVPGLQDQVNDISWLRISGAGGSVVATLVREGEHWQVEEAAGYRADWESLQPILSGLASARVVEPKTSNPAYYDRLGVEDVNAAQAGGYLVEFDPKTGFPAVIVGKQAQGRNGQYVRLQNAAQSVLVDVQLELPADRQGWLDVDIVDIGEAEVVEIEIAHADGEKIIARKTSADDENFVLENIPEGYELKSSWGVNSLAGNLSSLTMEAVAPVDSIDWAGAVHFRLLTADGLNAEVELVEVPGEEAEGSEYWLRLESGVYMTKLGGGVEDSADGDVTAERAAAINSRVSNWAYRIPRYKYDSMAKRMEDLVQQPAPST